MIFETDGRSIQHYPRAERAHCPVAVEQIQDPKMIALFGAPATPALIVNGQVVSTGCVPEAREIKGWLQAK